MTRSLALICCTAALLLSSAAWAKPKVALTAIDGDASGDVHDAVEEALSNGGELALISNKEVTRAVDKVGDVADLSEKDLKKLSTQLGADAIVVGKLEKSGKTKSLKFQIFVHKKLAKGFTVNFKDAKSEKFHKLLHDKILDRLGVEAGSGGEEEEEKPAKKQPATGEDEEDPLAAKGKKGKKGKKAAKAEEEEETKPKKAAKTEEEEEAKPKKAAAEDEEETKPTKAAKSEDGEAPAGDEDGEAKPKKKVASSEEEGGELEGRSEAPVARSSATPAVRIDIGASVVARSFNFNATSTMTNPRSKSLSPVPGARLAGEIYPLAISGGKGAASNLGLGFDYDRTLSLKLTSNANMMSTTVKVKQSHWSIGLRYRLAFGAGDNPKTLTIGVGYGKRLFAPDRAATMDAALALAVARDTPTSEATVIDPGVTFRLPFTRAVALGIGARGLLVTNTGSIQSNTSYGQAKVYGVEGVVGVDIAIGKRFALRLAGEITQVGYSFKGKGQFSNALDGDATTQDVGGLADRSIGGSATFGVLY